MSYNKSELVKMEKRIIKTEYYASIDKVIQPLLEHYRILSITPIYSGFVTVSLELIEGDDGYRY